MRRFTSLANRFTRLFAKIFAGNDALAQTEKASSPEDEPARKDDLADFAAYCDRRNWFVLQVVALSEFLGFLLHWMTDHIAFADDPRLLAAFAQGRMVVLGTCLFCLAMAHVLNGSRLGRRMLTGFYFAAIPVTTHLFLAWTGHPGRPWWWAGYVFAMVPIVWLFPLARRAFVGAFLYVSMVAAIALAAPPSQRAVEALFAARVGLYVSLVTLLCGHVIYLLVRENFLQGKKIQRQNELTLHLNTLLSSRLEGRTRELLLTKWQMHQTSEEERARLEREMHDDMNSMAVVVQSGLQRLDQEALSDTGAAEVHRLKRTISSFDESVRRLFRHIPPRVLDDLGFVEALRFLAQALGARAGIQVEFLVDPPAFSIPEGIAQAGFRIAQEALMNVERHADAAKVEVVVALANETLTLAVRDDGKGLPADFPGGRVGIAAMKTRAAEIGGTLALESEPGRGTEVIFSVDLRQEEAVACCE